MMKTVFTSALAVAMMTVAGAAFAADGEATTPTPETPKVDVACQEEVGSATSQEYLDCVKAKADETSTDDEDASEDEATDEDE